jgi:hypothetical protein
VALPGRYCTRRLGPQLRQRRCRTRRPRQQRAGWQRAADGVCRVQGGAAICCGRAGNGHWRWHTGACVHAWCSERKPRRAGGSPPGGSPLMALLHPRANGRLCVDEQWCKRVCRALLPLFTRVALASGSCNVRAPINGGPLHLTLLPAPTRALVLSHALTALHKPVASLCTPAPAAHSRLL